MEQELSFDPGHTKFTVPDGATPGSVHGVFLPGGYRAALTVPAGAKAGDELTFRCTIVDKEPQKAVITKPKEDTRIGLTLWSREETDPPLVTEIHPEGAAAGKVEVGDTLVRLSGPHRIKVVEVAEGGAAAGKVQAGDVLVTIDGKSFGPFGHEAATTFLKAAVGEVKVVVQRQGEAVEAAFTKDAPDTKTGIVLQGGPLDEPALGMYAATQILRSAVGELTIDYLRGAPQPAQLVLCSGFLDKRSPKTLMGVSAWQTRWFELTPTALTYWEPMEAGIEAAKRKEGDLDSLKKPVYRGCIELSEMVGVRVDSKNEMRFELLMKSKRLFQLSAMDSAERQKWADTLRQAQLDVLSASAGAVTLAAPTEEAVYAEEGADAVDGVGEGFGGRVRGASTASETGVPETAGDVAQQC